MGALLVACQPPASEGPHRELPGTSTGDPSPGVDSTTSSSTTTTDDTGPDVLDTGTDHRGYPSPDCATVYLPGPSTDVAATPRSDHDAEVLALSVDPARAAAPQARYDVVTADLAAIRALDPTLADVHVGCMFPSGIAFSLFDHLDVNDAMFAGDYHSWDCHHPYFHLRQALRLDGITVAIELDGVFGEAMSQSYGGLPGLDDHQPYWFPRDDWPGTEVHRGSCTASAGSITLTPTLLPDGALDQRDYRFERTDGSTVTYRARPDQSPQLLR